MAGLVRSLAALMMVVLPTPGFAGVEVGAWQKDTWTQANIGCLQRWTCHPKSSVLHGADEFVAVTKPANTIGACSAGAGPIDSCNHCLAAEPAAKCVWQIQKKK